MTEMSRQAGQAFKTTLERIAKGTKEGQVTFKNGQREMVDPVTAKGIIKLGDRYVKQAYKSPTELFKVAGKIK